MQPQQKRSESEAEPWRQVGSWRGGRGELREIRRSCQTQRGKRASESRRWHPGFGQGAASGRWQPAGQLRFFFSAARVRARRWRVICAECETTKRYAPASKTYGCMTRASGVIHRTNPRCSHHTTTRTPLPPPLPLPPLPLPPLPLQPPPPPPPPPPPHRRSPASQPSIHIAVRYCRPVVVGLDELQVRHLASCRLAAQHCRLWRAFRHVFILCC